jgi:alkylated DNA repair dioxygenase AlkB
MLGTWMLGTWMLSTWQGIGWHRDRPQFGSVLGLSLSSEVVLRMRRRLPRGFERCAVTLPPRSLYRLDGSARWG